MDADVAGGAISIVVGLVFLLFRGWLARQTIAFQNSTWGLDIDERNAGGLAFFIGLLSTYFVLFGIYLLIKPMLPWF